MNKKIWIGIVSVFLVVALILGIQMGREKSQVANELKIDKIVNSEREKDDKEDKEDNDLVFETEEELENLETEDKLQPLKEEEPTLEDEDPAKGLEETESTEAADSTETDDTSKKTGEAIEEPAETSKVSEPSTEGHEEDNQLYVTLSVSVETLLDKEDIINPEKWELVPKDGWIFPPEEVEFFEGESAFNVLLREMKKNKIHMEFVMTPIYNSNYIKGIGNLYEFDCGELSGWMYAVNDLSPNFGTTNYILKDGDTVKLMYTCDLGRDLGYEFNE